MKIFLLIALCAGAVFTVFAGVVFLALLRWLNLVIANWSGPRFQGGSASVLNLLPNEKQSLRRRKRGEVKRFWRGAMKEFREVELINRTQRE